MSDEHLSTLAFDTLPLHPTIMQGIVEAGFTLCMIVGCSARVSKARVLKCSSLMKLALFLFLGC